MKETILGGLLSVLLLSLLSAGVVAFFFYDQQWIGAAFLALGFIHLAILRFFGRSISSIWPDLIFGGIDNGFLVLGALLGGQLAGVLGAVVGGSAANAITDGFAGLFEGWSAVYLRRHHVREQRTPLSSAVGKMAGCFFGAGIVFVLAWAW